MARARWARDAQGRRTIWTATRDCCKCAGYAFPHRRTGGACTHGPRADYHLAIRHGVPQLEALQYLSVAQLEMHWPLTTTTTSRRRRRPRL